MNRKAAGTCQETLCNQVVQETELSNASLGHPHTPKKGQENCSENSFSVLVIIVPYIKNMTCFPFFIFNCFQSLPNFIFLFLPPAHIVGGKGWWESLVMTPTLQQQCILMGYFTQRRINLHKTQLISLSHTHEHSDAFILNSLPIIQVLRHLFPGSLSRVVCSEWRTTKSTFETLATFYGFLSVCYQFGMCPVMPMRSWQWLISSSWPTSVSHWDLVTVSAPELLVRRNCRKLCAAISMTCCCGF